MLTKKEMSKSEFDAWREGTSWFFDALKERQTEYREAADTLLAQFSTAPYSFKDEQKQTLIAVNHRGQEIQDIIDIEYEDIIMEDDHHTPR